MYNTFLADMGRRVLRGDWQLFRETGGRVYSKLLDQPMRCGFHLDGETGNAMKCP